jgi:hypothetical protein
VNTRLGKLIIIIVLLIALARCSGGSNSDNNGPNPYTDIMPPADGVASFTVPPVDISIVGSVTALGHIEGGGHAEPTSHAYIYDWDLLSGSPSEETVQNVYAPATGNVIFTLNNAGSWKIIFRCTDSFYYYLDHVVTSMPPAIGTEVHAGDLLGQTQVGSALDVGAFDATVTLTGFVNPARYGYDELHCVTPWEYFVEPYKSQLYDNIYRAPGAPADARIDQDVSGTLAGTWFEQSLPVDSSIDNSPQAWPKTISFALDEYDGSTPRVSVGGWPSSTGNPGLPVGGVWAIPSGLSSWSSITVGSGLQGFPLLQIPGETQQEGLLAVQMINDSKIEIEIWPGSQAAILPFDSAALFYIR